jgi:methylthioxylose transferase
VPSAGVTATRPQADVSPAVSAAEAPGGRFRGDPLVPLLVCGGALVVLAVGLVAKAAGVDWGTPAQPLTVFLRPALSTWALPAALILGACLYVGVRLARGDVHIGPSGFAAATFALTLLTRLALNVFRGGPGALRQPFVVGRAGEGRTEFLPGLPFLEGGVGHFLSHFTEISPKLPIQAQGHPPGLLLTMHYLGIDTAGGLAALTILVGALATPLLYLLARELAPEAEARAATLLFVFVPTSLLYGATSADALFATLGVLAAVGLLARRPAARVLGALALALATFFSYALLAVGAWAALVRWRREGIGSALRLAALCAIVLVACFVVLDLVTGFSLLAAIRATDDRYREGIARLRPYAFWFFGSPAAFVLMLGPIAWFVARSLARKEATALALAIVIAVSVIAGYTKAETERIWIFLVPFACLAAARSLPRRWLVPVLVAATSQAALIEIFLATKW